MVRAEYGFMPFDNFSGELVRRIIDAKRRPSLPPDALETIARRNRTYILNAESRDPHSPFVYGHPSIYMGQEVVATLEPIEGETQTKDRDLVQLVNGKIVDISNINSILHAKKAEISGKRFLVAYPFFDWVLYFKRNTMHFTDEEKLGWIVANDYTEIDIDERGRIVFTRFMKPLELSREIGYKGFGPVLMMGNPDYLMHTNIRKAKTAQIKNKSQSSQKSSQREFSNFGYEGFGSFLVDYPKELMQEEFPFELHPRVPRIHPRGSKMHPRAIEHSNNPPAQLDLHSLSP